MTNNAVFVLVLGAVVVGGVVAIAMFNKTTDPTGPSGGEQLPTAPAVDPNVPEWARAITGALSPLAQAGSSIYTARTEADLARARARQGMAGYQNRAPRQPLAGYAHSISA